MPKTHEGYFLIADITGYTRYLNESELEHAQETLTALLELLVEKTGPPLVISRLAGDAVISYGLRENFFQGQTLIEKIEDTYVAFRKTIERMALNTTCPCQACANIPNLDLKFFIHYGAFGIQQISDHEELVGSDVNVIHRLLKNSVTEKTGVRAYALYTEAALRQLAVEDLSQSMTPHQERYDHLGEVNTWVQDMDAVWKEKRDAVAVEFPSDRILSQLSVDISLPRERVWDYLIQAEYRNSLMGSDRMVVVNRAQGRIVPGSVYQCYHGDKMVPQTIMEWQPFESMVVKEVPPMSPSTSALCEYRLQEIEGGTRLTKSIARPTGPLPGRVLTNLFIPLLSRMGQRTMEAFGRQIEEEVRLHGVEPEQEIKLSGEQIRDAAAASLQAASDSPLASSGTWDLVADAYTVDVLPWAEHFAREALQLATLPPSPHIVDVACGPGTLTLLAAQEGITVSAIDFSPEMVANLKRRAAEAGLTIADVRVGDGQDLPYDDNSFDGAFSLVGLVFFPDRGAGFRELHRILRPGRRAVVSSIASLEGPFGQVLEAIRAMLPGLPFGGGKAPLGTPEEFTGEMSAAGFRDVSVHTTTHRQVTPTMTEFWEKTQRSAAPVALLQRKLGQERWADVANSVYEQLRRTVGEGPVEEISTIHLGVGIK